MLLPSIEHSSFRMFLEQVPYKEGIMPNCGTHEADMVTVAFGIAFMFGFFFGTRIPIAVAAAVAGILCTVFLVIVGYYVGMNSKDIRPDDWRVLTAAGASTFTMLTFLHIWAQRREGRPGW